MRRHKLTRRDGGSHRNISAKNRRGNDFRKLLRLSYILGLAALIAATQQNDDCLATLPKIHPKAGTKVNAQFADPAAKDPTRNVWLQLGFPDAEEHFSQG